MKILLVSDYAVLSGGAEIVLKSLRDALRKRGHIVTVFSSSARYHRNEKLFSDHSCFGTVSPLRVIARTLNPWAYFRLRKILKNFQPDIVHVHLFLTQLSPLILPVLKKYPSVYHAHWQRAVCPMGSKMLPDGSGCHVSAGRACYKNRCIVFPAWLFVNLQMRLFNRWRFVFDRVIANSQSIKDGLQKAGIEGIDMVWNGVPERLPVKPISIPPRVVFAGRLIQEKGVDVLIGSFVKISERYPDARLVIAGDGPQMGHLKTLARRLNLMEKILFTGYLSQPEMEKRFESAWIQVIPSRCLEACPLTAMEAMMRGTAVVASDIGGLGEIIRASGTGVLVPPGDPDALARVILHLIDDRQRCGQMGMAGRRFALKSFSIELFTEKIISIYRSCLLGEPENGKERD
jgi:glycosyltransferase involved in cell wall biosynthesis